MTTAKQIKSIGRILNNKMLMSETTNCKSCNFVYLSFGCDTTICVSCGNDHELTKAENRLLKEVK